MFTNGWPPKLDGADSFTRVLGSDDQNVIQLRYKAAIDVTTKPSAQANVPITD